MGRDARSLTRTGPRRAAAVGIVAALALAAAQPAIAAEDPERSPSADELWDTYPLHPAGETAGEARPSRTPVAAAEDRSGTIARAPASPATADGGGVPPALVLLIVALAAAGAGSLLWTRRHVAASGEAPAPEPPAAGPRARAPARLLVPTMRAAAAGTISGPTAPAGGSGARDPHPAQMRVTRSGRGSGGPEPNRARDVPIAAPPDPARDWTAEVEWSEAEGGAGFRVVARDDAGATESTVAESTTFAWPPADSGAVQALTAAAEKLEAGLLAAGWTPMPPGDAWYAKRFAWKAVRPAPATDVEAASPRTLATPELRPAPAPAAQAPLPARTESVRPDTAWWCEIEWRTAVVRSRFHVVVHGPEGRRSAASSPGRWLLMSEPDPVLPDVRAGLRQLADALEGAGWEPAGKGAHWYAERFAWRREEPPPDLLEVNSR
jgi:hypothetical protein